MKIISHRGNLSGPNPEFENTPKYIDNAILLGFDVEIDVWFKNGDWFLGHDYPTNKIEINWLLERESKIWVHCKNLESLVEIKNYCLNYFWHENDEFTLTSKNYIWANPRKNPIKKTIVVLPEIFQNDVYGCSGICSDYVNNYQL
jgi:hypothetical protein